MNCVTHVNRDSLSGQVLLKIEWLKAAGEYLTTVGRLLPVMHAAHCHEKNTSRFPASVPGATVANILNEV